MKALDSYICNNLNSASPEDSSKKGYILFSLLLGLGAAPVFAYLGSYAGEYAGLMFGRVIDYVPLLKYVGPWIAERADSFKNLQSSWEINQKIYQIAGTAVGFWGGAITPITLSVKLGRKK